MKQAGVERGYTLYGMPASLYTAKPRAYLRKQGIQFVEHPMGSQHFQEIVVPKLGRLIVPVLEAPDGELIQDGAAIIDYCEAAGLAKLSAFPGGPCQRAVAYLFELFGGEGLLRPAMHYRWNFPEENEHFLRTEFGLHIAPGLPADQKAAVFEFASSRMKSAMEIFGVNAQSIPLIERAYAEFLALFEAHLEAAPYLLGGRPSVGDYGLLTALFAHLGRDPKPADLMRRTAPRVARWVERMNAPGLDMAEYVNQPPDWFAADEIPETLRALMHYVAEEYLDEITAQAAFVNQFLEANPDIETGSVIGGKASKRALGRTGLVWRGLTLSVGVFPYRLWLLQRILDTEASADANGRQRIRAVFKQTGLEALLDVRTHRRVERRDNREIWDKPGEA